MRTYYLFKINDSFSSLYQSKTYYLYKMLEQISNSNKSDIVLAYRLFEQISSNYDVQKINGNLYRNYNFNSNYTKSLNFHMLNNSIEKTKLFVHSTYIKIKTNKNITSFFKTLSLENNIFVCDFKNRDYFWLNSVLNTLV